MPISDKLTMLAGKLASSEREAMPSSVEGDFSPQKEQRITKMMEPFLPLFGEEEVGEGDFNYYLEMFIKAINDAVEQLFLDGSFTLQEPTDDAGLDQVGMVLMKLNRDPESKRRFAKFLSEGMGAQKEEDGEQDTMMEPDSEQEIDPEAQGPDELLAAAIQKRFKK